MKKYTLKDLRIDLYIDDEMYDEIFNEWKEHNDLKKVIERVNQDKTLIPVLESDLQREEDFLEENDYKMVIVENYNGIILYRKEAI